MAIDFCKKAPSSNEKIMHNYYSTTSEASELSFGHHGAQIQWPLCNLISLSDLFQDSITVITMLAVEID